MITTGVAAERLKMDRRTVSRWARNRVIPATLTPGGIYLVNAEFIEKMKEALTATPPLAPIVAERNRKARRKARRSNDYTEA